EWSDVRFSGGRAVSAAHHLRRVRVADCRYHTTLSGKRRKGCEIPPGQTLTRNQRVLTFPAEFGVPASVCGVSASRLCPTPGVNCTVLTRQRRNQRGCAWQQKAAERGCPL